MQGIGGRWRSGHPEYYITKEILTEKKEDQDSDDKRGETKMIRCLQVAL